MIFTLEYRQLRRFLTSRYLLLYFAIPMLAIVVTMTNDWHGLMWNSFHYSLTEPNSLIYGHGSGYYVLVAYNYLIVLLGMAVMVRTWLQSKQPYRRQVSLILFSCIFPILSGLAYTLGLDIFPGLDITPISFLITGLIIALGVLQFGLFDLAPMARHYLIENMDDGILVLDAKDRIVDINPMAENIIGAPGGKALGLPISEVLASWGTFLQSIKESNQPK